MKWMYGALAATTVILFAVMGCGGGGGGGSFSSFSSPVNEGDTLAQATVAAGEQATIVVDKPNAKFVGVALSIPSGTLPTTEVITISRVSHPVATEPILISLSPEGLVFDTTNATPTITVTYTDQFLADNAIDDPANIRVASQNSTSGIVETLTVVTRDPSAKTITAAVPHFSLLDIFGSATQPIGFAQVLPAVNGPLKFYSGLPLSAKTERTLVIVHGICSSGEDMIACPNGLLSVIENSDILRNQYTRVYIFNYPWKRGFDGTADEPSILNKPAEFLQLALSHASGDTPTIDILAHSMGGCVSRYALEQVDVNKKARAAVDRLVMIATPNGGVTGGTFAAIKCTIINDLSLDFQAAVDLSPFSLRLNQLANSQFDNFNVRYVTIAGDVVSTGTDVFIPPIILGVAVTSVQLNEQGSTETRPQNYEHITFHGKPGAFLDTAPAGHTGLHCNASNPDNKGAFTSIESTRDRTFELTTSNVGTVLETLLRDEAVVEWTLSVPDGVGGCPAIGGDGTIYVVGNGPFSGPPKGKVFAIDRDGKIKAGWPVTVGPAGVSSPVISPNGILSIGSFNEGRVYYLSTNATPAPDSTAASIAVGAVGPPLAVAADETIYAGTGEGKVVALVPTVNATGDTDLAVRWTFDLGSPVVTAAAIAPDGTVYEGGQDGTVVALDPAGNLKAGWPFAAGDSILSAFAIAADGAIVFATTNKKLHALKPDGTLKNNWPVTIGDFIVTSPAVGSDGTVYVGAVDGKLYAFTGDGNAKPGWPVEPGNANDFIGVTPTIGSDGTIYVDSGDALGVAPARLTAFTPDGALRPTWPMTHPLAASMGMAMLQDGTLVLTTANNDVMAIRTASFGLAASGWPKFQGDGQNSGRTR